MKMSRRDDGSFSFSPSPHSNRTAINIRQHILTPAMPPKRGRPLPQPQENVAPKPYPPLIPYEIPPAHKEGTHKLSTAAAAPAMHPETE